MKQRFLTVPINETGMNEYDQGIEHTDNMVEIMLPNEEFEYLYEAGIFNYINDFCGVLIDDYESEVIQASELQQCLPRLEAFEGQLLKAVKLAISYNTFLALDF